jgi:hypothetical protein
MTQSEQGATPVGAQVVLQLLGQVDRRLRLNQAISSTLILAGLILLALSAWRLLGVFHRALPVASALVVLIALLAATGLLLLLGHGLVTHRGGLGRAAAQADRHAGLRDELLSALDFVVRGPQGPWTRAQIERAAGRAQHLDPARLARLRVPARVIVPMAALAVLLAVAWRLEPMTESPAHAVLDRGSGLTPEEQAQVHALEALAAQAPDAPSVRALRQALEMLQRRDATDEDKRRALAHAQEAAEQSKLEAASAREGMYRLGQRLRSQAGMEEVAQALAEGDARKAADLLERKAASLAGERGAGQPSAGDEPQAREKDLEKLLHEAAQAGGKGDADAHAASVAMKEAVDRLKQIASELEVQGSVGNSSKLLQQLQLSVAQRSTMSAGRFAQQAAQDSSPASESGDTVMPGGKMFRSGAVAQESERSEQQEGSKSGDAQGESVADPLLGEKVRPLEVQLKQEGLPQASESDEKTGEAWFYAESKEQKSALEARAVQARAAFAQAETTPPAAIAVRHRQTVKEYFMNLREGAK